VAGIRDCGKCYRKTKAKAREIKERRGEEGEKGSREEGRGKGW
jgi:hypothetical protein